MAKLLPGQVWDETLMGPDPNKQIARNMLKGKNIASAAINAGMNTLQSNLQNNMQPNQTNLYDNMFNTAKAAINKFVPGPQVVKDVAAQTIKPTFDNFQQGMETQIQPQQPLQPQQPMQTQQPVQQTVFTPQYRPEREALINQMQSQVNQGFQAPIGNDQMVDLFNQMLAENNMTYDAANDPALAAAQQQAMTEVQNRFAASGMLYGDSSKAIMANEASKLVADYTKQFYMNQQNKINNMLKIGEFGRSINSDEFEVYTNSIKNLMGMEEMYSRFDTEDFNIVKENIQFMKDQVDSQIKERKQYLDEEKELYKRARDRVEDRGYVDNEASYILGLPVGTLSKAARERIEAVEDLIAEEEIKHKYDVAKTKNQYDLALRNTLEAEKIKSQNDMKKLSAQESKEKRMVDYKAKKDVETAKEIDRLTYKQYFDAGNRMLENEYEPKQLVEWINQLEIDENSKESLINDLDIRKAVDELIEEEKAKISADSNTSLNTPFVESIFEDLDKRKK